MKNDPLCKSKEIAAEYEVKPKTVEKWARQGIIPSVRPTPRVLRFNAVAVRQALEARQHAVGAAK